ncbi:uncharacterized protein LOC136068446 [Quercus suber]|uniref:uncharacterized protein LOC136068446 n=1 Tax=Quercus suber TaxID=58331 RepID=UPI0032DE5715
MGFWLRKKSEGEDGGLSDYGFKEAHKDGPFLGIDGCHLKGPFGGVLLVAISLDGDNGLFPVAVTIVEVECKGNWLFFLHHLDLALGLIDAVARVFLGASHRLCCRHIYSNYKVKFPGFMLKIDFWATAKVYNEFLFNKAMQRIRVNNDVAYVWGLRAKPTLTTLDGIHIKIIGRLNKRLEKANTLDSLVSLKIKKTLDLIQQDSRFCKVITAGDDEYQIVDGFTTFVVNLIIKTCACSYWKTSNYKSI